MEMKVSVDIHRENFISKNQNYFHLRDYRDLKYYSLLGHFTEDHGCLKKLCIIQQIFNNELSGIILVPEV